MAAPSASRSPNSGFAALLDVSVDAPLRITSVMPPNDSKIPSQASHGEFFQSEQRADQRDEDGRRRQDQRGIGRQRVRQPGDEEDLIQRIANEPQPDDLPAIAAADGAFGGVRLRSSGSKTSAASAKRSAVNAMGSSAPPITFLMTIKLTAQMKTVTRSSRSVRPNSGGRRSHARRYTSSAPHWAQRCTVDR